MSDEEREEAWVAKLAAMTEEWKDLLLLALLKKRDVDGLNGRTWNAGEHLQHEDRIKLLLGEAKP